MDKREIETLLLLLGIPYQCVHCARLVVRADLVWVGCTADRWTRDYPGVDIDAELAGINRWCKTATAKALKIKRWSQFIDNWLQKALADRAAGKRPTKRHTINRPLFSDGDEFERQAQARAQREQLERDRLNAEWLQRTGNA